MTLKGKAWKRRRYRRVRRPTRISSTATSETSTTIALMRFPHRLGAERESHAGTQLSVTRQLAHRVCDECAGVLAATCFSRSGRTWKSAGTTTRPAIWTCRCVDAAFVGWHADPEGRRCHPSGNARRSPTLESPGAIDRRWPGESNIAGRAAALSQPFPQRRRAALRPPVPEYRRIATQPTRKVGRGGQQARGHRGQQLHRKPRSWARRKAKAPRKFFCGPNTGAAIAAISASRSPTVGMM